MTDAQNSDAGQYDDDEGDWSDVEQHCQSCHGEGWEECMDPIQCTREHDAYGMCRCGNCGGSGLAKDQTVW